MKTVDVGRTRPITRGRYYGSFWKNFSGIAAILNGVLPLASLLPGDFWVYVFPPLGDADISARLGTVLLAFFVTYTAFFAQDVPLSTLRHLFVIFAIIAFVSLGGYIAAQIRFVRRVPIPTQNTSIQVSVGYNRTPFAVNMFGTSPDSDMLRQRGTTDEEVRRLWTLGSLIAARLTLYFAYCGVLLSMVGGFSLGVIYDLKKRL